MLSSSVNPLTSSKTKPLNSVVGLFTEEDLQAKTDEELWTFMNKVHVVTYLIIRCEEEDPLRENESKWHPDFDDAVSVILDLQHRETPSEIEPLNELFEKWRDRFYDLGLEPDYSKIEQGVGPDESENQYENLIRQYVSKNQQK